VIDEPEETEAPSEVSDESPDPVICAACGSLDISRTPRLIMFLVIGSAIMGVGLGIDQTEAAFFGVLALAIYFLILGRWRCSECGHTWN
jgi:hypothetical protein